MKREEDNSNGDDDADAAINRMHKDNYGIIDSGDIPHLYTSVSTNPFPLQVYLAVDELHIYRYEGDDSDVDDLSEIEDGGDEDDEYEQEFEFLKQWGSKFDKLSKMYEGVDD